MPPLPVVPRSPTEAYVRAAKAAGCPPDQLRNFLAAGIVLQPRQLAFAAAARLCDRPDGPVEVALGGARGPGKSHALLCQLGDDGMRHAGLKMLLLRKVGASAREGFEGLLPKTIGRLGVYTPSQGMFRFHNGSSIRLGHFQNERDVDKYLGLEYDVVALEEATTLSHAKKTAIFSCCRSPVGGGWRARKYLSTNPGGVGHAWFKARFVKPYQDQAETETRFIPCTVADNAFASADYVRFLDSLTGWLKRAWRYGDWDIAAGQYFTTWRRDLHVVPPLELPRHWRVWLAIDYGFVHYTAAYLLAQDGDGNVFVAAEHAERRWLVERHCRGLDAMLARHGVQRHRLDCFVADPNMFSPRQDGGTIADDYATHGYELTQANNDRINGAAEILRRLGDAEADPPIRPRLFVSELCPRLIECLPALEHDPHRPEDVLKTDTDENGLGGDDSYDAARYGIMAVFSGPAEAVAAGDPFGGRRW
jgi:phage terminase large subunit